MNVRPLFILIFLFSLITPLTAFAQTGTALVITSPSNGTVVHSGETIIVTVDAPDSLERVLLSGPGIAMVDQTAPFVFEVVVPLEVQGEIQLTATGRDNNNNFLFSDPVTLMVEAPVVLTAITVDQPSLHATLANEQWSLTVVGTFSNGATANISSADKGTVYSSLDETVATVSPDGLVTTISSGETEILVRNGSLQIAIPVSVNISNQVAANQAPVAVAGEDMEITENEQVVLDASGSYDPDQGPTDLTYTWTQISGKSVLNSQNARSARTTLPALTQGIYVFELVVNDGELDSQPDTITIFVGEIHRTFLSVVMTN